MYNCYIYNNKIDYKHYTICKPTYGGFCNNIENYYTHNSDICLYINM